MCHVLCGSGEQDWNYRGKRQKVDSASCKEKPVRGEGGLIRNELSTSTAYKQGMHQG